MTTPHCDCEYIIEASEDALKSLLGTDNTVDITPYDLFQADIKSLRSKCAILEFQKDMSERQASSLARKQSEAILSAKHNADEIAHLNQQILFLKTEISSCNSDGSDLVIKEMTRQITEHQEDLKIAVADTAKYRNELAESTSKINLLGNELASLRGQLESFRSKNEKMELELLAVNDQLSIAKNSIKAAGGHTRDHEAQLTALQKKLDKAKRENEVIKDDFANYKRKACEFNKKTSSDLGTARSSVLQLSKTVQDQEQELAHVRKDRRYLTQMVDALNYESIYTCEHGQLSILCFIAEFKVNSPNDSFKADEDCPLGIWVGANGLCCVVGVSKPHEDGSRDLILPIIYGAPTDVMEQCWPPKDVHDVLVTKLMQIDVKGHEQTFNDMRLTLSRFATSTEDAENAIQLNKNLIAVSKPVNMAQIRPVRKSKSRKK